VIKVLHVIPDLNYRGATKFVCLLATGLPQDRFRTAVATLGPGDPLTEPLRALGFRVTTLDWRRAFDVRPFLRLRHLCDTFRPDVIHAWRLAGLRAVRFVVGRRVPILASSVFSSRGDSSLLSWLDRAFLRQADLIGISTPEEKEAAGRLGVCGQKLVCIPPAVSAACPFTAAHEDFCRSIGLPTEARFIACVGPFESDKGHRDAIWAFDILKFLYNNLHLILVGSGSYGQRLQEFARRIHWSKHVHFVGPQRDATPFLAQAEFVWVPSRARGGMHVALEAMAAGRPVLAARIPDLAAVIEDGVTGFLVPPGDKVAMARQARVLIDDSARARQMGEAGRQRALSRFAPANLVERLALAYDNLGAGGRARSHSAAV